MTRLLLFGAGTGLALAVLAQALRIFAWGNVHTVLPDEVYRSAQLPSAQLERLLRQRGIQTVVNLRGCAQTFDWYQEECRVTRKCDAVQEDVCLSSGRLPSTAEIRRLVEVIDRSRYPILLHCYRGIDRTGLASAVVLLLRTDVSVKQARGQLGCQFGHFILGRTGYIDHFFDLYQEWLEETGQSHSPAVFRHWATEEYRPETCLAYLEWLTTPQRLPPGRPASLRLRATNMSGRPWQLSTNRLSGIHAYFVLYNRRGSWLVTGHAGLFDAVVAPGESIDLTLALPALPRGRYQLIVDMEEPGHCLFFQTGSEPLEQELIVSD